MKPTPQQLAAGLAAHFLPCDLPCPKCGSADVHRLFHASGSTWSVPAYGKANNRFAYAQSYQAKATRDHIAHHCRCCQHDWQTVPLSKRREAAP